MRQNTGVLPNGRFFPKVPRNLTGPCLLAVVLVLVLNWAVPSYAQGCGTALGLNDYFANWTTNSTFLTNLAKQSSDPAGTFVIPTLGFSQSGLEMSGPTEDYQTTGMQSLKAFSAPFTATIYASPNEGQGNPIEIFLTSADLSQYLTLSVNFNPTYEGIWVNAQNVAQLWQLGQQFNPPITPAYNTLYQFIISVDKSGAATVTVEAEGNVLGTLSSLQLGGTGPFYVVLGQRIGLAPQGSQAATWKAVSLN